MSLAFGVLALLNSLSIFVAFSNFKANQSRIEAEYCINKDATDFDCGGQCYFMKKMRAAENAEMPSNSLEFTWLFQPLYFEAHEEFVVSLSYQDLNSENPYPRLQDAILSAVFRPPRS